MCCVGPVPGAAARHRGRFRSGVHLRLLSDRRGQSTLEFALIALVLMMFVFGGVALLNGFSNGVLTTNAARDGARIAAIDCGQSINPQSNVYTAVYTDLKASGDAALTYVGSSGGSAVPGDWSFSWSCGSTYATVGVQCDAADLFPAVLKMVGMSHAGAFTESSSATFPIE